MKQGREPEATPPPPIILTCSCVSPERNPSLRGTPWEVQQPPAVHLMSVTPPLLAAKGRAHVSWASQLDADSPPVIEKRRQDAINMHGNAWDSRVADMDLAGQQACLGTLAHSPSPGSPRKAVRCAMSTFARSPAPPK